MEYRRSLRHQRKNNTSISHINLKFIIPIVLVFLALMVLKNIFLDKNLSVSFSGTMAKDQAVVGISANGSPIISDGTMIKIAEKTYPFEGVPSFTRLSNNGKLLLLGGKNNLTLISEGELLWSRNFTWEFINLKVSDNGSVLALVADKGKDTLLKFDLNGQIIWDKDYTRGEVVGTAISEEGYIGVSTVSINNNNLEGIVTVFNSGRELWSNKVVNDYFLGVSFGDGNVLMAVTSNSLTLYNEIGRIQWAKKVTGHIAGISDVSGGTIAINQVEEKPGNVAIYSKSNLLLYDNQGNVIWEKPLDFAPKALKILNDNRVLAFNDNDVLIQSARGAKWKETVTARPMTDGGKKFLGITKGSVFTIYKLGED